VSRTKKRLFVVKDSRGQLVTGHDGQPLYFNTKPAAKLVRNQEVGRTVGYGPDHKKTLTLEATKSGGMH
jgi:hypothetical protein